MTCDAARRPLSRACARAVAGAALAFAAATAGAQAIRGVTEDSTYTYLSGGRVVGPVSEVVDATMQRAGFTDYRATVYPWARAYDMALQEPNVLIFLIARTPAREAQFKWVSEFMRLDYHLYKLRTDKEVVVKTLADARAYSVGVVRDDMRQQYLQAQGFTRLVVSAQNSESFRKLLNRQVQLVPLSEHDAVRFCEDAHVDFGLLERTHTLDGLSVGLYMAYSRSTADEVVLRTRSAYDKLKAEGSVARLMKSGAR